jgi:probable HAF family extracellular repeat protein
MNSHCVNPGAIRHARHCLAAWGVLAVLTVLAALLAPLQCQAGATYTVTLLPAHFSPADINNAGQMAGTHQVDGAEAHAAIYAGGVVTDLGAFDGSYSYATAINEAGAVAGNLGAVAGAEHAFLYQHGVMRDIGVAFAAAVNASGAVVGRKADFAASGSTGFVYHDGVVTELGQLGSGNMSLAAAINDAGHIVGESNIAVDGQVPTRPYLYDGEALHDLGTLADRGVNSAVAINNAGQVAGYSEAADGRMHAFFYEHGVMTDLGSFGGLDITIGGMNQHGQVVGTGNTWDGPDIAFISSDGALVDLNTLVDPALGWRITSALDINDHGQIIANACSSTLCSAVRLDLAGVVPEPAGALQLLPGLMLLACVRKRRGKTAPENNLRRRRPVNERRTGAAGTEADKHTPRAHVKKPPVPAEPAVF